MNYPSVKKKYKRETVQNRNYFCSKRNTKDIPSESPQNILIVSDKSRIQNYIQYNHSFVKHTYM